MARNKLEKMGLLKIVAVAVVSGSIIFTMTACSPQGTQTQETVAIEQTTEIATEDNDVAEVDLIENADDFGLGTESEQAETYKIEFKYSCNEEIEAKTDVKVTIPEYQDTVLMKTYYGEEYFTIADDAEYAKLFETISTEKHEDGSATIIAKGISEEVTFGMVTRYSYDDGYMKAIFTYKPYIEETDEPISTEDFGLNFVIEKDVEGNYKVVGLQDLAGNRCDDIILYYGDVIGWSLTENAHEVDFEFEDEIYLSQDLTLYPVVANMLIKGMDNINTKEGLYIQSIAGTIVEYRTTKQGEKTKEGYISSKGKIVSEDGNKEYNPDSKAIEDRKPNTDKDKDKKTSGGDEEKSKPSTSTTPGGEETKPTTETPKADINPYDPSTAECDALPGDCAGGGDFSSGDFSDVPRF